MPEEKVRRSSRIPVEVTDADASVNLVKNAWEKGQGNSETGEIEYLRTIGAFFAIYWLARIGIDGERGFSYGVDEKSEGWAPLDESKMNFEESFMKSSNRFGSGRQVLTHPNPKTPSLSSP